jgi:hypothetical protein
MRLAGSLEDPKSAGSWTANRRRGANPSPPVPAVLFQLPPETKSTERERNAEHIRDLGEQPTVCYRDDFTQDELHVNQLPGVSIIRSWT